MQTHKQQSQKITLIGGIVNLFLAIIKIIIGFVGNSAALLADGIHSLSDLISDFVVYWTANHSTNEPDAEHPYGHARFETVATLGLGLVLAIVGFGIIYDSILNFNKIEVLKYSNLLLAVAIISILSKEVLYHSTMKVAKKINSKMLEANAWHHRLDSFSSIVVLVGIIGAIAGFSYLDNIAAIIVGLMVGKIAWDLSKDSINELVDTAIDLEDVAKLKHEIGKIGGVVDVHMLRTRKNGYNIIADVHIQVEPFLSVSEGHIISVCVERVAKKCLENLSEVMVHIDPEDDEKFNFYDKLPTRAEALGILNKKLLSTDCDKYIADIRLHYLGGRILVDFYLPLSCLEKGKKADEVQKSLQELVQDVAYFEKIRVFYE